MNRIPVNGSKPKKVSIRINQDDNDTNSTDSFDMNDFKTSTLNKKYSVPIHKNKADLMAELNNINIMGDESDIEPNDTTKMDTNGLNANVTKTVPCVSDRNSSKITNQSLNTTTSSNTQSNGELTDVKHERILAWAQSQSQNLSMCVASILSDHDYLSQEHLLGIITGNEENTELEINSREINDISNTEISDKQAIDSQETILYANDTNVDANLCENNVLTSHELNEINTMVNLIKQSKSTKRQMLLEKIMQFSKEISNDEQTTDTVNDSKVNQIITQHESNNSTDFSPNHSEPLEYYGDVRFSAQSSIEELKEIAGDDDLKDVKNGIETVKDMANRISDDTAKLRDRLETIKTLADSEQKEAIGKLRENFGLLVGDMATELTKIALKLNPKAVHIENETSNNQTVADVKDKRRSVSDSSDETYYSERSLKSRKVKRRRKKQRGHGISGASSSSSNESIPDKNKSNSTEPFVISQNVDDLMNGGASNSANESLTKENDCFGFDQNDEIEIGIKTEVMLNSEKMSQQNYLSNEKNQSHSQVDSDGMQNKSIVDENTPPSTVNDNRESDPKKMSAIEVLNRSSSSTSLSEHHDDDDDDDVDDDDEIRKLCDLSTCKRVPKTSVAALARGNGMIESKKTTKKAAKEDLVDKFLANSDDTENPIDSEEEKPECEEEKPERAEYTEQNFLQEKNLQCLQNLLEDSSEGDESDDENEMNGKGYSSYDDVDKTTSESDESLLEKFFQNESKEDGRKSPDDSKKSDKDTPTEVKSNAENEKKSEPKTKETPPKKNRVRIERFDAEYDSDIEFEESDAPRKTQSTVGKNVFSSIEKEHHVLIPTDDEESGNEIKKKSPSKRTTEADSSENNSEILDTSEFKTNKKEFNPQQLPRILQSNRNKPSTSRVSPECISVSSDDDIEMESTTADKKDENEDDDEEKEKRVTRKLLRPDQLADDTKQAQKEEQERIKRLDKKNERLTQFIESQRLSQIDSEKSDETVEVVLDISKKDEKVVVHREITKHLKAHQVEGIKFMYDCCYGSVDNLDKFPGSGCILAHCMGLGKTLQLISLLHTVICYPKLKTDKVLVICPKSTVMNWKEEIERWLSPIKHTRKLKLFHFPEQSDVNAKLKTLQQWSQCGKNDNKQAGCLLLGYEAFRVLVFYHNSKKSKQMYTEKELDGIRKSIHKYLLDPGADLVVCDEGHMIKNQKSTTSMAVNQIITKRRIVLTGTPIQNNLKEYYSMVNFIKPSFLGTEKEFANLYVNPIKNGQHKDSSKSEIKYMKQRSYVLHKKLSRFVQRREAALLKSFLPDKYEYVLFIPMTEIQTSLYEFFLENRPNQDQKGKSLIPDYTVLRKIWTHPKVLENAYLNAIHNKTKVKTPTITPATTPANLNDSDDDQPDDVFDSQTGQMSVTSDWWRSHLSKDDLETILPSNKLKIVFEILKQCQMNKEKCLIFSAFVAVLDVVEFFMRLINDQGKDGNKPGLETFRGPWEYGRDYYRLDGKTAKNMRHNMITNFNDPKNVRTRVFLISAKAGGQGINLIGANRVILLDTSWNPSNDQQNIFRVFRLGQKRVCYIYRLLSMGTMEEKVYSRSVTKQAMSCRVMDEQQIDRHYNMAELTELYILTKPSMAERPTPNLPKDDLLKYLLLKFPQMVYKYHEHDSLLENKGDEELSEQEKNDAWAAYEADVKRKNETNMGPYNNSFGGMLPNYSALGTYASSLFNNYNNLSGVSGLNYPYNPYSNQYPYPNDSHWQFNDYTTFYNNLMTMGRSTMSNYSPTSPNLLSPNHPTGVSSPPPPIMNMNNFPSSRNWMQSNASSSNYANSLLSSLAQTSSSSSSSSSKNYQSYLNSLYNALGTNNAPSTAQNLNGNLNATTSKTPPLPLRAGSDFDPLSYLQKQSLANLANLSSSTSPQPSTSSAQQGPNALRNPMLTECVTKELLIPRNPTLANAKELFNLPIPTSVITKSTTSSSTTLSSNATSSVVASDANKSKSKSSDLIITSTVDKGKTTKNTTDNQLIIKDVRTINNESRDSPDTTGNNQLQNKNNSDKGKALVSNGVSSSILAEMSKKANRAPNVVTPVSTNMGIVYPPSKPTPVASTSKSAAEPNSTILSSVNTKDKEKEKETLRKTPSSTSSVSLNKTSNQPMPAIIRKPNPSNTRPTDPTNDAVAAINKNKALTVTARSVVSPASKTPPVADVNNSITLSPIPNTPSPKFSGVSIAKTTTPTHGRTQSPLSKSNASTVVPVVLSKVNINHGQTTITKSPTPATKTNGLGTRKTNTNTIKVSTAVPKIPSVSAGNSSTARTLANSSSLSPKVIVSTRTTPSQPYKPIIAQTKAQAQAQNNSAFQVKRVVSKPNQQTLTQQATSSAIATKLSRFGVEMRKRAAPEPISIQSTKRTKPTTSPLQGIRVSPRPPTQSLNSQITPVEIVELE